MKTRKNQNSEVSVDDLVFGTVLTFLKKKGVETWSGTMTDLNKHLMRVLGKKQSNALPGSPSALRVVLNRVVRRLRKQKISVRFGRTTDHTRTRYVRFAR